MGWTLIRTKIARSGRRVAEPCRCALRDLLTIAANVRSAS